MEEILTTDHASQLVSKVNANFDSEVVSTGDYAAEAVSAMNAAFEGTSGAETMSAEDTATDLVADLNTNFELYEQGGGGELGAFKFLHVSDPHGYADAIEVSKNMMAQDSDISFLFVTGDVLQYNTAIFPTNISNQFDAIPSGKLLLLAGNHDTYDMPYDGASASQQTTTNYIKHYLSNNVTYGDTNGVASYWHKDFAIGENKLRIISLDQYEIDVVRKPSSYYTVYSQAQINWFIGLLKGLTASDYLIIATHESPVQSQGPVPSGQSTDTYPDSYAVGLRPSAPYFDGAELREPGKLFVTEGLRAFGNRRDEPNFNLLPRIMDAYLNGEQLNMTYNNKGGDPNNPDITINEDFSLVDACTFLFYVGGHRHADIGSYLPNENGAFDGGDWSSQLMLYITCADKECRYSYDDDLGAKGSEVTPTPVNALTYRINEINLDFDSKTITVNRIGSQNTSGGRVRDAITFPFVKQ